jgi:hypothetical protein
MGMMDDLIIVGDFVSEAEAKAQRDRLAAVMQELASYRVTVSEPYYRPAGHDWVYAIAIGERV